MDQQKQPETLKAAVEALGLEYRAEFVPFSKSRNAKKQPAKPGDYSLNWKITINKGARSLTTDYMQGIAHIPGYTQRWSGRLSVDEFENIKAACESGRSGRVGFLQGRLIPAPELHDVMYSLAMDAGALDAGSFEEWAGDYGYEPDSRSAEKLYRECLKIALELRAMIGEDGLQKLRDASQNY
jgi:hypothetical protein